MTTNSPIESKPLNIVAIILTFNSQEAIAQVIESCQGLVSRVFVVDSFSTDNTIEIVESLGCELVQHKFANYSQQRNWAQANANLEPDDWVLHLDSDEMLSPELAKAIVQVKATYHATNQDVEGYLMQRLSYFLGQPIKYGHINPSWHLRLYRADRGFCEERLYDQHFVVPGKTQKLEGLLLDLQLTTIERWTAAHNRWSSAEAIEQIKQWQGQVEQDGDRVLSGKLLSTDWRMQKRWVKNNVWKRVPLFWRSFIFFFYSYFLRLGFLDGKAGLVYHVLQAFWFKFLIDAKILEIQLNQQEQAGDQQVGDRPVKSV
ncbi:glycosyl transferase family 2 [Thalassoporum mexicanum PCC 7367]|uniref:glycosyltransferase family 2 protein n=1 Tax=Thalassoporum mexicanum TaxID=3457544 RepID=UPI00029FA741|nr:glycosyltransferase family 2 protein [Pseudanabaena sp. PCC 7367]AFY69920.1 glycosyl transferase family 2 [Pseudanabaena sp. PCC 7367]